MTQQRKQELMKWLKAEEHKNGWGVPLHLLDKREIEHLTELRLATVEDPGPGWDLMLTPVF